MIFVKPAQRLVSAGQPSYPDPLEEWDFTQTTANSTPNIRGGDPLTWTVTNGPLFVDANGTASTGADNYFQGRSSGTSNIWRMDFVNDAWTVITVFSAMNTEIFNGTKSGKWMQFSKEDNGNQNMMLVAMKAAGTLDLECQHGNQSARVDYGLASLPGFSGDIQGVAMAAGAGMVPAIARSLVSTPQGSRYLDENQLTVRNKNYSGDVAFCWNMRARDESNSGHDGTIKRAAAWNQLLTQEEMQAFIDFWK